MYIIFAGPAFLLPKSALWEAIRGREAKAGGDLMKSMGVCLPLEILEEFAEQVIIL